MIIATLFTESKIWDKPKCPPTDDWMKENGVSFSHKEALDNTIYKIMERTEDHSQQNKLVTKRNITFSTHVQNLFLVICVCTQGCVPYNFMPCLFVGE